MADLHTATGEPGLHEVVVIIPARNEQRGLPLVLAELPVGPLVIVVDNGSTDATAEVAHRRGALVVHEPRPGYGAACLAGLALLDRLVQTGGYAAIDSKLVQDDTTHPRILGSEPRSVYSPRVVALLDADYSDHSDQLPRLLEPILAGRADFVLGSRLLGEREPGAMPPQSIYGNKLACLLMRVLWGARYSDLGPFRAIGYDALRRLRMQDRGFGWTVEMQLKAAAAGLRVVEIAVPYRCRVGTSKISGTVSGTVKAGTKILYTIAKHWCTTVSASWRKSTTLGLVAPNGSRRSIP